MPRGWWLAFTPLNLFLAFAGAFIGTVVGMLPALGPINAIAILLPFCFSLSLPPESVLILLTAVIGLLVGGQMAAGVRRRARNAERRAGARMALLQESLLIMRLVKSNAMELFNQSRVERQLAEYADARLRRVRGDSLFRPLLWLLGTVTAVVLLYVAGLMMLIWGLGSFAYFGGCELLLRGQTLGKRLSQIRVVKVDGFQLDAASILVRNIFRVVDHLPPMWILPFLSRLGQRAGDMVAGTLVVHDAPTELSPIRTVLAERVIRLTASAVSSSTFRSKPRYMSSVTSRMMTRSIARQFPETAPQPRTGRTLTNSPSSRRRALLMLG